MLWCIKNRSDTVNREKWSILNRNHGNSCPKCIFGLTLIWLFLGAQKELCAQILQGNRCSYILFIVNRNFGKSHVDFPILVLCISDNVRRMNLCFLKIERLKLDLRVLEVILSDQGPKNLLGSVIRTFIPSIASEEIVFKNLGSIHIQNCMNHGFLKRKRPKSSRGILKVILSEQGPKNVLETALIPSVLSIVSEEIMFKDLGLIGRKSEPKSLISHQQIPRHETV